MPRTKNTRKNEDVYLMMECREEQLSSSQINAFKRAEQEYEVASNTIKVIMKNSEKLHEEGDVSLIYFKNNISSSQHLEITPDNETFLSNTDAENSGYEMYNYNIPVNNPESMSLTPTVVSLNDTALKHPATYYTTNYQLFIVGGLPHNNIKQDTASKGKNPVINLAVQVDSINKSTPTLYSTVNDNLKFRNNSGDGSSKNLFNQNTFIMAPVTEQEDLLPSFREKKMFPSLVVIAKPYLVIKAITLRVINEEQLYLDEKVKILLTFTAEKFTEWLLNQGFIHSNQFHKRLDRAIYLDSSKFSHSEGCVWVNDCCPRKCFSIFSGSIFEGSSLSLAALLKLLYHWSSQTNTQNVVQWVKVNNIYLKTFYTNLRAVCVAAIHEEYKSFLGGKSKVVEVGVISLGTLSRNSMKQNVKMWILGAMESKRNLIKLYVLEPLQGNENNSTALFVKILEPLINLVHKESIILIDSTLDKSIFFNMGYNNVIQTTVQDKNNKGNIPSNENIMLYLTKCIPHMFQNTLSYLSRQIIQQFLDELVWRERWGQTSLRAFHSIINHIGEQTKIYSGKSLISCLSKIAINPFIDWQYSQWKTNMKSLNSVHFDKNLTFFKTASNSSNLETTLCSEVQDLKIVSASSINKMTPLKSVHQPLLSINKKPVQSELTNLENYYYGISPGNEKLLELDKKCELQIKCVLCSSVLKTNICLMKHLIKHALSTRIYTIEESISWCKYCLKELKINRGLMNVYKHTEEAHFKTVHPNLRCRICEEDFFRYRTRLILHMHCFHTEIEMPYECGICKFRSSEHHLVVDHFYETHSNGEKAQCPLCLKIVAFKDKGNKITQNIYFFLNHIRKHTYKKLVRKCKKCVLSFVNKGILEYHQRVYHRSCKDIPNLKRYDSSNSVLMPTPSSSPTEKIQSQSIQEFFFRDFTCIELNLTINTWKNMENMTCCECEGYFLEEDHFPGYLSCIKCSFNTCCDKSMFEHIVKFHDNVPNTYKEGIPIVLEEPMCCVCGFKSVLGNRLADHLVKCGKKTVYPSIDEVAENNISHLENNYDHGNISDSDINTEWSQEITMIKEEEEYFLDKENYNEEVDTKDMSSNMLSALELIPNRSLIKDDLEKYGENCQTIKHKFEELNSYVNKSLLKKQKLH